MRDFVSWNISRRATSMAKADAFVVSFPKSGRTWFRVFYLAYLSALEGRPFSIKTEDFPGRPRVNFTHDRWEHRLTPGWWHFVRGKFLIPERLRRERKIILLVRDPRDVTVSLYFHLLKRQHIFPWKQQSMAEMLRDPMFGITHVIELMNQWLLEWNGQPNFKLLRYEDCQANTRARFRESLQFLGLGPVNEAALSIALEFSTFDNMHAREAQGASTEKELAAGDTSDADSFKARRGKVGGFRDYFNEADINFAAEKMAVLDSRFGYTAAAAPTTAQVPETQPPAFASAS